MARRADTAEQQSAGEILAEVRSFLESFPGATVLEGGETIFDLREASHRLEELGGRVTLQVWSAERNVVRRVMAARRRGSVLRMEVQRFGRREPESMELVAERGQRLLLGKERERQRFVGVVERVLRREFPMWRAEGLRSSTDLQHSFGPGYVRGVQVAGRSAWAVVAVRAAETAATVDGVLTVATLWMVQCREQMGGRRLVEGVRVIVPAGMAETTLARVAWMDRRVAKWEVYELDERAETMERRDPADRGNVQTRLQRAVVETDVAEGRFAEAMPRVMSLLGGMEDGVEMRPRSGAELALLRHGMEFARVRMGYAGAGFRRSLEITVGSGAQETVLTEENAPELRAMVGELFRRREVRDAEDRVEAQRDVLFRAEPERWLESRLREDVRLVDAELQQEPVYAQVSATSGVTERGVADLLGVTRDGRLAVMEVKAEEDLHLPMQGLDYWIRMREHHLQRVDGATGMSEVQAAGYFPGVRLQAESPVLYLLAPALRIHPSTEVILRHFDPRVPWQLVALDERWRERVRVVWRRSSRGQGAMSA